jgi:toxin ParE1/3/4
MKQVRLLPEVFHDVAQAAEWYDEKGYPGLGDRFLTTFYAYFPRLLQEGEIYKKVYRHFRRVLLKPFPYSLYYRYDDDWLVIVLVIHAARSPRLTRKLLSERH